MKNINKSMDIPDKNYFKIGEVVSITGVESYVLRFWESEFKTINPKRTQSGQRLYRRCDVELILKIKKLLYEKKFTIQGAKQNLRTKNNKKQAELQINIIDEVRSELLVIRDLLA
jgi:DNA-binding transcriptional MerR regulator